MATIFLGTSGFSYRKWIGSFYPAGIKNDAMLQYYSGQFNAVELNNTFYRLPSEDNIRLWQEKVPFGFRFAVKASKRITHGRDFGMTDDFFSFFLSRIRLLKEQLGPLLFQFPPYFSDPGNAMEFVRLMKELMPGEHAILPVMEVRNSHLLQKQFYEKLAENHVSLCFNDEYLPIEQWPEPGDIAYLRLRQEIYKQEDMQAVAQRLSAWMQQGKSGYVFFKHEQKAPEFVRSLKQSLLQFEK